MRAIAGVSLLFLVGAVHGQTPAGDDLDRLMAQLSSAKYAERAAAMKALEERGAAALPALYKAADKGDLELQRRAALLIERIENRLAVATLLAGKKVRLVYQDVLVLDAVAAWWTKTGIRVEVDGDRVPLHKRKITLDTGEVTFWEAFTRFCEVCGLTERPAPGATVFAQRISLMVGKTEAVPTALAGPLRIRALPPGQDKAAFRLEVSAEPLLPWQGVRVARFTKLVDPQGQPLALAEPFLVTPKRDTPKYGNEPPHTVAAPEILPVQLPPGVAAGTLLKEIHGTVTGGVQVLRKLTVVKYASLTKGKTLHLDKLPDGLHVLDVQRNGDRLRVRFRVHGPLAETIARNEGTRPELGNLPLTSVKGALLDGKGQPWKVVAEDAVVSGADGAGVFADVLVIFERQAKQDEPAQLVVSGAVSLPLEIPFVLRDVPGGSKP